MPDWLPTALACLGAYIVGATPWGYWAGKMRGVDLREHGSGNIGTTNVFRILGRGLGIAVFVLDVLKGLVPVLLAARLLPAYGAEAPPPETWQLILVGVAAILGHNYTFWLGFKGGKGIATSAGAVGAVLPWALLAAVLLWIVLFLTTRYVAVASLFAAAALPVSEVVRSLVRGSWDRWLLGFALFLFLMAVWRHRSNIGRLIAGTENRFGPQKEKEG